MEPVPFFVVGAVWFEVAVVVAAVLEVDADGLFVGFEDPVGVDVAAFDVGVGADKGEDFAEVVGSFPGDFEGGDGSGAGAADAVVVGVFGDVVFGVEFGHEFVADDFGVFVIDGVVFAFSVGGFVAPVGGGGFGLFGGAAGVDEDGEHDGDFASIDEVIEDVVSADVAAVLFDVFVFEGVAVVEDHEGGW